MIDAVAVVVPAHNEEELLPACLKALRHAASQVTGMPVHLVLAADACTDRTAEHARARGFSVTQLTAHSVGAARAAGMRHALAQLAMHDPGEIWLASTDADTLVPEHWLTRQLAYADQGWDVVLGTITVRDWPGQPPHLPAAFADHYGPVTGPHPHVHGANLGIRASAYLASGGFRLLPTAEDHALLDALAGQGCRTLPAADIAVETSGRKTARAPCGFSRLLSKLAVRQSGPARP